jgi:hypothetical protein
MTSPATALKISKSMTASGPFEVRFKELCPGKHWGFTGKLMDLEYT